MADYSHMFSEDVSSFFRSPVREIFKKVDLNAIYSFAGGYPSAETFPMEEIRRTMSEVIDKYQDKIAKGISKGIISATTKVVFPAEAEETENTEETQEAK